MNSCVSLELANSSEGPRHIDLVLVERYQIVYWLIERCVELGLLNETFSIAVNLFDRSRHLVAYSAASSQWLMAVSLLIASKYMEVKSPKIEQIFNFLLTSDSVSFIHTVHRIKINILEVLILRAVDYRVRYPSGDVHLEDRLYLPLKRMYRFVFFMSHFSPTLTSSSKLARACTTIANSVSGGTPSNLDIFSMKVVNVIQSLYKGQPELTKKCQAVLL